MLSLFHKKQLYMPLSALGMSGYAKTSALTRKRVRVSTAAPNQSVVEGTIYVADPSHNFLVLNVSPAQNTAITPHSLTAPSGAYRVIPISQISSFQIQAPAVNTEPTEGVQNTLDVDRQYKRLQTEITRSKAAQMRQGPKGTTPAAQALFDAFSRTMPTRWHEDSMIVSDTFVIQPPYKVTSISLIPGTSGDLDRMMRVLDMEKNKIYLKLSKNRIDDQMGDASPGKNTFRKGG